MTRYLDYSATTPVDPRVLEAMLPYFTEHFGNANSLYAIGRDAFTTLEEARTSIAGNIGAKAPSEFVFTSGGTESDNMALIGSMNRLAPDGGGHIVTSAYEHHAILEPAHWLEKQGHEVTLVKPGADGHIHAEDVAAAIKPNTKLVSIIHANNEVGAINDIKAISEVAHAAGAVMHTDAVQSLGKIPFDVEDLGIDLASFSAHKIYGPKGIGGLYIRRGTKLDPFIKGGGQEQRRRSGTQNVAGAVGFAKALELMIAEQETEMPRLVALRDSVIEQVLARLENTITSLDSGDRLPNIAPLIVKGVEGESMLLQLDNLGFSISTGSACSSGSLEPSHVLLAIGIPQVIAHGSLRVSLGRYTTQQDIDDFVEALVPIVERLRAMSPVYTRMFCSGK
ncbi:MAG: cysteine desulfurase [Coriobacteriia bacterium]|nr:cysteine desulfurase [Coriobacteriia bacterium]